MTEWSLSNRKLILKKQTQINMISEFDFLSLRIDQCAKSFHEVSCLQFLKIYEE